MSGPVSFFYGLQPRWLTSDRLYRVYVSDNALVAAYVAGQLYDANTAAIQLQQAWLLFRPLIHRWLAKRHEREHFYDSLEPFNPQLLYHDARNFRIDKTDVLQSRFRRNRSLWTPFNVGSVEFDLLDGSRRRFILIGDQEPELVLQLVQRFAPAVAVSGDPCRRRRREPITPARKRRSHLMAGVFFVALGVLSAYVAVMGMAPKAAHIPLAVVNLTVGGRSLWNASRVPKIAPDRMTVSPIERDTSTCSRSAFIDTSQSRLLKSTGWKNGRTHRRQPAQVT